MQHVKVQIAAETFPDFAVNESSTTKRMFVESVVAGADKCCGARGAAASSIVRQTIIPANESFHVSVRSVEQSMRLLQFEEFFVIAGMETPTRTTNGGNSGSSHFSLSKAAVYEMSFVPDLRQEPWR